MNHLRMTTTIAVAMVISACGSTEPEMCQPETQALEVTTEVVGQNVVLGWTPECGVRSLFLESDGGGDVWAIEADGNGIMPPVTYGTAPPGVLTQSGPSPLIVGQSYFGSLARALPTGVACNDIGTPASCRVAIFTFTR